MLTMLGIHDYIKVVPNVLDPTFCNALIQNQEYRYQQSTVLGDTEKIVDSTIRNCGYAKLFPEDDAIVYNAIGRVASKYMDGFKEVIASKEITDEGYYLLQYKTGGFYRQHIDDDRRVIRRLSISLLLNDDYDGGEFQFFGDYKINCGTGSDSVPI